MKEKTAIRRKSFGVSDVVPERHGDPEHSSGRERLQKAMAAAGIGSRRACERLIAGGRVTVNGVAARPGTKVDVFGDEVAVDGAVVDLRPRRPVCLMMYKPRGYVTTRRDPQGRKTVMDLVASDIPGLHPVGRLDYDSEGLLLLTNDGGLTHYLTHPRHEVEKVYEVTVDGIPTPECLRRLRSGVELEEGVTAPARVRMLRRAGGRAVVGIGIRQGWNRQVRRMLEAVGHPVVRLKRTGYAFLRLGGLKPGQYRFLGEAEIRLLRSSGRGERPGDSGRGSGWRRVT